MAVYWKIILTKWFSGGSECKKYSLSSRSHENIEVVRESVVEESTVFINRHSEKVWSILRKDLALKALKAQITSELKPLDDSKRTVFVQWAKLLNFLNYYIFKFVGIQFLFSVNYNSQIIYENLCIHNE